MDYSKLSSAGGKATGIKLRTKALEEYYKNPSICLECQEIINVSEKDKVYQIKKKKFCNSSCSVRYNNKKRIKKEKKIYTKKSSLDLRIVLRELTKDELFNRAKSYQSARNLVCKDARNIYSISGKDKKCYICEYDKHVDIAHIFPVSGFGGNIKISEINSIDNLICLCPNHHWEYDNKIITIRGDSSVDVFSNRFPNQAKET